MKTITLEFYECEHQGDLDNYLYDVRQSGGKIISERINYEAEIGIVAAEVQDDKEFWRLFKETEAYNWLN